mgnify:CR=1 FL=1
MLVLQIHADLLWPNDAVVAVTGLEKVAFDTLGSDMHKYNLKMRQLEFNLKVIRLCCILLARVCEELTGCMMCS